MKTQELSSEYSTGYQTVCSTQGGSFHLTIDINGSVKTSSVTRPEEASAKLKLQVKNRQRHLVIFTQKIQPSFGSNNSQSISHF